MKRSFYRRMVTAAIFAITLFLALNAEAVRLRFPNGQQPGEPWAKAIVDKNRSEYLLGNAVFTVKFVCTGGKLTFAGCEAMNLSASDNLFTIELADGKRFTSSDMRLEMVTTRPLTPADNTRRFSEQYSGKAISATFVTVSYTHLTLPTICSV